MNNGQFFDIGCTGKGLDNEINKDLDAIQTDAKLELADLKRQVVYLQVFARRPEFYTPSFCLRYGHLFDSLLFEKKLVYIRICLALVMNLCFHLFNLN